MAVLIAGDLLEILVVGSGIAGSGEVALGELLQGIDVELVLEVLELEGSVRYWVVMISVSTYSQGELQDGDVEAGALTLCHGGSGNQAQAGRSQESIGVLHIDQTTASAKECIGSVSRALEVRICECRTGQFLYMVVCGWLVVFYCLLFQIPGLEFDSGNAQLNAISTLESSGMLPPRKVEITSSCPNSDHGWQIRRNVSSGLTGCEEIHSCRVC